MSTPQDQLIHLISYQRKDVPDVGLYGKLTFEDLKRLDLITQGDIILSKECCLYKGKHKNNYSTFSFKGKKVSLLRILYHNYWGDIKPTHRIQFTCENEGLCCNINHYFMVDYDECENSPEDEEISNLEQENPADDEGIFKME